MKVKGIVLLLFSLVMFFCVGVKVTSAKGATPQPVPTPPVPTPPAQSYVSNWNLVDSGCHCDWKSNSAYTLSIQWGTALWNGVENVFRQKSLFNVKDLEINDVWMIQDSSGNVLRDVIAQTSPNGEMKFATGNMALLNTPEKHHIAAHELGRALGIAEQTSPAYANTIMYYQLNGNNNLSQLETATLHYLYRYVY